MPAVSAPPEPPVRSRRGMRVGLALVAVATVAALSALAVNQLRSHDGASAATTTAAVPASPTTQTATTVPTPTTVRTTTTPRTTTAVSTTATTTRPTTTTRATSTVPPTTLPSTTLPNTLDGLVQLLSTSATSYGTRGPVLLARLEEIQSTNARKRGGRARRELVAATLAEIDTWVRDGTLAPSLANRAQDVLRALAV